MNVSSPCFRPSFWLLTFALANHAASATATPASCLQLPPYPNNDADAKITVTWGTPPLQGLGVAPENSAFWVDIQQAPTPPIPAGRYAGWCFDVSTDIDPDHVTLFGGLMYSTCGNPGAFQVGSNSEVTPDPLNPGFNDSLPNHPDVKKDAATWKRINYLLNHRRQACGGNVPTMYEVQCAIYRLMGQPLPVAPTGYAYPNIRTSVIDCLVNAANANAETWVPQCGDVVAVIYNIDVNWDENRTDVQLIFLEVPMPCTKLGDRVWNDQDGNGKQDTGEPGISGVTVELYRCGDNVLMGTTVTDANGNYYFSGQMPGSYYVKVIAPANYLFTAQNASGTTADNDSDANASGVMACTTLTAGETDLSWDAGLVQLSSLAGNVYHDKNNDGTFQGSDIGIDGVTVTLTGTDNRGTLVNLSTSTAAGGSYSFPNLWPGTYEITETQPATYLDGKDTIGTPGGSTTNDKFSAIALPAAYNGQNNNFGEVKESSLSGFVYYDANNNGLYESGETPISGVTVTLTGTDDLGFAVSKTTPTDSIGAYSFDQLRPGTYTITETQPGSWLDGKDTQGTPGGGTTSNDAFTAIALGSNVHGTNNNFGELQPASLAGHVYYDANNNGVFDSGETAISGATVTLTGTDDLGTPVNATTTTVASGAYSFTGLRPGTYAITETQPAGYLDGKDTIGTPGGTTGNDAFSNIVLGAGVSGVNNNFGEVLVSSIGGFIYYDANNNGIKELGEAAISGATVTLSGTNDLGASVTLTTTTDGIGAYNFTNLRPGTYTIVETQPAGYLDGKDTQGSPGTGVAGNDSFTNIILPAGFNGVNNNFGELLPASLSGYVYYDADNDGVFDSGETAISGATVTLTGTDYSGNSVNATTTTVASGAYSFTGLRPGTYVINETQPSGYLDGKDTIGTPIGGTTGNDVFSVIVLSAGFNGVNNNFGELLTGSLGNRVWGDLNSNGIQDSGEPGVDGVKVTLYSAAGANMGFTTTAGGGFYKFENLMPGEYYVIFDQTTLPAGYVLTLQNFGASDALDSDANPSTGKSEGNATVVGGAYNDTVDAGLVLAPVPCVPTTLPFSGSSSALGTAGNIRTFTVNGISVKASAFSRTKGTSGTWSTAYLGAYSGGLGVTDASESGSGNTHTVNNVGRDNYILFEFSQPVVINRAYLGYVYTDSDLTAWFGNVANAYNNHQTLSDPFLNSFVRDVNTTTSSSTRWATLNSGGLSGNILVIAADVTDTTPDDYFKVGALDICAAPAVLSLACVSNSTGTVGTPYSSALVASGGKSPYTYSITSGSLPTGLTLNGLTGTISGSPSAAGTFSFTARVVDSTSGTAQAATGNCSITIAAAPVCVPTTFSFSGSTSTTGSSGNIRVFTVNGITVKVSGFSRSSTGSWAAAYLGAYSGGLGVTDTSENGSSPGHTVDNVGRDNFVLFEFSQPIVINRAFLGYVVGDSDLTAWVGNIPGAYSTHVTLSDTVLNGLTSEENTTDSSNTRWAKLNGSGISGNILVIAASLEDDTPDDNFKVAALDICQPTTTNPVTLGCVSADTGKVGVYYASSLRAEGGTPGYTFSIVSGSLPPGLTLKTSTGAITGTPTTKGTFNFTAKVVDSTGTHTASQSCGITIAPSTTSPTGQIGSLVWKDKDGDGIQDAGEPGISGITVYLKNSAGTVIATDTTDINGVYLFEGLYAGTYTVVVSTPSGYVKSPSVVGTNRAIDSNGSPATVTLSTNSSVDLTIDFGFLQAIEEKCFTTYTQGGWGSKPSGNNPGAFLTKNFSAVYPGGYVAIGTSSRYLAFTSADAVIKFLPQGGTAGVLTASAVNPTSCSAGVLAGQLLAATLNVDFSNKGRTMTGLATKHVGTGPLNGKTVAEVIAIGNSVIAGGSLSSDLTLSKLVDTLTLINENYDNGGNEGDLY